MVPNNGDSSALVLTSLPAGYHLTTNLWPQLIHDDDWLTTRLMALLYNLGTDHIENTASKSLFYCCVWILRCICMFVEPLPINGRFILAPLFWLSGVMSHYLENIQVHSNDSNKSVLYSWWNYLPCTNLRDHDMSLFPAFLFFPHVILYILRPVWGCSKLGGTGNYFFDPVLSNWSEFLTVIIVWNSDKYYFPLTENYAGCLEAAEICCLRSVAGVNSWRSKGNDIGKESQINNITDRMLDYRNKW
jgi:hypothetical protein